MAFNTEVRLATASDAGEIIQIYAPSVLTTATSFETVVPPIEEMQTRIESCLEKFPWIVALVDGRISGYVYASKHREREAYQWSCECSVYVRDVFKGKGIGKILYELLFQVLKIQGFRNVYAGITLPNETSVRLHEKCGFTAFAKYDRVGYKFGHWHTVGWWKLQINNYDLDPPPPLKIRDLDQEAISKLFQQTALTIQSNLKS
jgi:L-amino acid N-acyltransferase YncA